VDRHRPLFWHQGLFLQPQHFQHQDLHTKSLLEPFLTYMAPHFWGVGSCHIAEAALGNRSFQVTKGEFVFPDGTYVIVPQNALVEARPFDEDWIEGDRPLMVYLGLKKWDETGDNVTVLSSLNNLSQVTTRFVTAADPEETRDLHQSAPNAQLKGLYYHLKVFWATEMDQLGDYELVPVAQLERDAETIHLSERFIPPSLCIQASDTLANMIREIRDQIASRAHQLEQYKSQKGIQTAEFGTRDMVFLLALRSLNRYVPLLYHITEAERVHPWQVYGLLRQLIGELSSFSSEVNVKGETEDGDVLLRPYDHRNLGDCFYRAQGLIIRLLDEITAGPEYIIRLEYDGTYFAAELSPAIFEGGNRYYLVVETDEDHEAVRESLETVAKLGARESLPILIARALPGARLQHLALPPQELPRRSKSIYFQIDHHGDQWAPVEKGHNIALYWDDAPEDIKVELMVVARS